MAEGKLIFDNRPEVYYIVRPSEMNEGEIWWHDYGKVRHTFGSGRITIHFKAYDPFGHMSYTSYDDVDLDGAAKRCGIVATSMMPAAIGKTAGTYLVYNPGTERAYPILRLYGSAPNGLTIKNKTTNETCTLESFNLANDTWLEIDSDSGRVSLEPLGTLAFEYHLDGYLHLDPCVPYERSAVLTLTSGSNEAQVANVILGDEYVGHYVY